MFAQDLEVDWGDLERKQGSLIRILPSDKDEFYALRWTGGSLLGHYKISRHIGKEMVANGKILLYACLLYTSPSPRDQRGSRMPSSA